MKNHKIIYIVIVFGILISSLNFVGVSGQAKLNIPYMSLSSINIDGVIQEDEYPTMFVDPTNDMLVALGHDGEYLYIGLKSPGTGWLSIGLGSPRMDGANIIIGYVDDSTGDVYVVDETGQGHGHFPDVELGGSDDVIDYAGSQSNGETTLEFMIPLVSNDSLDPPLSLGATVPIIIAYHPLADDFATYHGPTYDILEGFIEAPSIVETKLIMEVQGKSHEIGESFMLSIQLKTVFGDPVSNATIEVLTTTSLEPAGFIKLVDVVTDDDGFAKAEISYEVEGEYNLKAVYRGGGEVGYKPSVSDVVKVVIQSPIHGSHIYPTENPYYNWGWVVVNLPHMAHGSSFMVLTPTTLTVLLPVYLIVLGVWLTYSYVYRLILKIKRLGR